MRLPKHTTDQLASLLQKARMKNSRSGFEFLAASLERLAQDIRDDAAGIEANEAYQREQHAAPLQLIPTMITTEDKGNLKQVLESLIEMRSVAAVLMLILRDAEEDLIGEMSVRFCEVGIKPEFGVRSRLAIEALAEMLGLSTKFQCAECGYTDPSHEAMELHRLDHLV